MRAKPLLFPILLLALWGCLPLPGQKAGKPAPATTTATVVVDAHTNIHFTGRFCGQCHERTPVKGGDAYLKYDGDYQRLCGRCHHGPSPGYCHPLEMVAPPNGASSNGASSHGASSHGASSDGASSLPADFPLQNGKFTCNTCHDMYRQCVKRLFDRTTLRGAPYPRKTDFCYRCHEKKKYRALNPHHQVLSGGRLDERLCLYCHGKKPDEKTATYQQVTFIGEMGSLCRRCHSVEGKHPGNFDHMAEAPSAKMLSHMAAMEKRYAIILPLARNGKMTCITCHNPHQRGVIAEDKPSAKGADSKYRERLPDILCITCHQM
jgi:hypothetical protein